jgi:Mor family transcriptional regulator
MSKNPANPALEESSALFLQREMQDIITTEIGMKPEFAALIASALVAGWRKRAGCQRIYIPAVPAKLDRDTQIRREFNGTNREEICRKHNISKSRLYQIVGS